MRFITPGRRGIAGVVAFAAAALVLAGCSGTSSSTPTSSSDSNGLSIPSKDPKATLTVLSILQLQADGMQPVVDAFEKAHPNIKITWQTSPFDSLSSAIDSNVGNKQGNPDLYWADQPRISALASRGEALDLSSAFAKYKSTFDPAAWNASLYQGKLYALPLQNSSQLLYYNKDLLAKAGVKDPTGTPDDAITWQQLAKDAKAAKDGGAENGLLFAQFDRYYQIEPIAVSAGGTVGINGKDMLTPDFTSKPWVDALDYYGQLFANGTSPRSMTPTEAEPAFLAGKSAYIVDGVYPIPLLPASGINWGVAPAPKWAGGKQATNSGSWELAVNPFSKQKQAAAIFAKWMTVEGGGGYIKYNTAKPNFAATPAGKKTYYALPAFQTAEGQKAEKIINYAASKTAISRASSIGYLEFEPIVGQAFSDIRNGADAKSSLDQAAQKLTTAWAKYK